MARFILGEFRLDYPALREIRSAFAARLREGLPAVGNEIRALPTFLPVPGAGLSGEAAVLDLGGSNLRAAALSLSPGPHVRFAAGPLEEPLKTSWPSSREFFDRQAELVRRLSRPPGLPLGYCFSYPALVGENLDAVLVKWTKGIAVPDVVGRPVGSLLRAALAARAGAAGRVTVLNDTVAALLGGFWLAGGEQCFSDAVGLVAGTGTNLAVFLPAASLAGKARGRSGRMAVNLESGNFHPPRLTRWDDELDSSRTDAGEQRLEKAVSGIFLPELYDFIRSGKARPAGARHSPSRTTAADMSRQAGAGPSSEEGALARALLDRSADLLAACLAGLIDELHPAGKTAIIAEGSVVNRTPGYRERLRRTLSRLLKNREEAPESFALLSFDGVNLVGAALAALIAKPSRA
jgi:hexokinase